VTLGQFGSSSETANNESTYKTATLGGSFDLGERFTIGADATYTLATETMEQLAFAYPADVAAILRYSTYDLSEVHTYSDLDSTAWDATVHAEAKLTAKLSGTASYQYIDYNDNAPYLDNLSGRLQIVQAGLRWTF
jgi:hypothetical protein